MRAPAQHHRPGLAAAHTWTHPYTGILAHAVFYNDGGNPTGDGDPAPAPKPGPPPAPSPQFTQDDLDRIAAKEKAQGQRAGARQALEDLAKDLGFTNPDDVKTFVAAARQAEDAKKTAEQKRQEELDRREQELKDREDAAITRERAAIRKSALVQLGATGTDLDDALALLERDLRQTPDADEAAVQAAAEALKERRAALFGAAPATPAPTMPPAPGGSPAGGPPPRQTPASKPGSRGLEMARIRGHNRNAA
ncbi:hypothetical protein OIE75_40820 (plasmid) [Streptomyces sp. NBC_01723]|uniref:hypothetical protein n=1 Tax=Streptomyces sp. NBC_01723 TaxID=2975921 RepID=UPI002E313DA4|nr:hypothetical protein [Streptomyces sp. NBC_01723]